MLFGSKVDRRSRRAYGAFRNLSGRLKRRFEGVAREFGLSAVPEKLNSFCAPSKDNVCGHYGYGLLDDFELLLIVRIEVDVEFFGGPHLQLGGPLFGNEFTWWDDVTDADFEEVMARVKSAVRTRIREAA